MKGFLASFFVLAGVTAAQAQLAPIEAYRQALLPCLRQAKTCDLAKLTASDRDYLRYELGRTKLSAADVAAVAEARMTQFRYGPIPSEDKELPSRLRKATVMILARHDRSVSEGSGFFVAPNLVVTNRHVIEGAPQTIMVLSSESRLPLVAQVAAMTPDHVVGNPDLAALWVSPVEGVEILKFARPDSGSVIAAGFPGKAIGPEGFWRRAQVGDFTIPTLTLSQGLTGAIEMSQTGVELIRHAAVLAKGNSGGPLIDSCGRVVGVNTFIRGSQSYALSTPVATKFLREAKLPFAQDDSGCKPAAVASGR